MESGKKGGALTNIDRYDYAFEPEGDAWAARILRRLPSAGDVLELGPGPGAMTRVMLKQGHRVVAVEQDAQALQQLGRLGVETFGSDLDTASWADGLADRRFDAILACDVLEHLRNPEAVLQTLTHHVQPTGRLIVSVPNIAYGGVIAALRNGVFDYADKGQLDRTHIRFFTRRSFETILLSCGWIPLAWEANRVPIDASEFAWHWNALTKSIRDDLSTGAPDFDVYQWMVEAVPAADLGWQTALISELAAARGVADQIRREHHALQLLHQREHESLIEHQKAFSEAKSIIEKLQQEVQQTRASLEQMAQTSLPTGEFNTTKFGWLRQWIGRHKH